jgi:predicted AAA+ superfamily ATPase
MKFNRLQSIQKELTPKRVLIIYGPRRVGKTTMLMSYLDETKIKEPSARSFYATGDDMAVRDLFAAEDRSRLLDFSRPYDILTIDEAQNVPKLGIGIKMIIDAFPEKRIILTGSSSFDLSREIGEPLTGRHFTMTLLPVAQSEMEGSDFEKKQKLAEFLIYGTYPEVVLETDADKKQKILNELVSSYLFKDILALNRIRSPKLLLNIVRSLAFQIGGEVSFNEIARTVGVDVKTVGRYIDLLEKMFVIFRVGGFRRNLRTEISKKAKYYFYDNGIRNAAIAQFNGLETRNDIGALWENFIAAEFLKQNGIFGLNENLYFWRTHAGKEIDMVRESARGLAAIECKWSDRTSAAPSEWTSAYPASTFLCVNKENYLEIFLHRS